MNEFLLLGIVVWSAVNVVASYFVVELARENLRNARTNEQFSKANAENARTHHDLVVQFLALMDSRLRSQP